MTTPEGRKDRVTVEYGLKNNITGYTDYGWRRDGAWGVVEEGIRLNEFKAIFLVAFNLP